MEMDAGILPDWVRWVWVILFLVVLAQHISHALRMHGIHRLWHCGHMTMALGMSYMFLPPSWGISQIWPWVVIFAFASLSALGYGILHLTRGNRVDFPWVTLTVGLAGMSYMWAMMEGINLSLVTWAAVVWFLMEAIGWFTTELCGRNVKPWLPRAIGPGHPDRDHRYMSGDDRPVAYGTSWLGAMTLGLMAVGMAHMLAGMHLMMF